VFEAGDNPQRVTLEPKVASSVVDGYLRCVIDTEGHEDGNTIGSELISRLADFLKKWQNGVNGVCIVLNGQYDRFSQGIKDILQWSYNTFGTPDVLNHICIIFTRCYDGCSQPNRAKKQSQYRTTVQEFLMKISGVSNVPLLPVFFVDSLNYNSDETTRNIINFHEWLKNRPPLTTQLVRAVELRERIEEEIQNRHFKEYHCSGPPNYRYRIAISEKRTRQKITPNNGDPVRHGKWKVLRTWEQPAGHQTIVTYSQWHGVEWKEVEHHSSHSWSGFSSHDHTHYAIKRKKWEEQWTETTDYDGIVLKQNRSELVKFGSGRLRRTVSVDGHGATNESSRKNSNILTLENLKT
jgi:hypothetical protein